MSQRVGAYLFATFAFSLIFCGLVQADETDLVWSTFLGGSDKEAGRAIVLDNSGNAYVTGQTSSTDFPTTSGAFDTTFDDQTDAFVFKLNTTGDILYYSTFLGGERYEDAHGIAVDGSGKVYVTGRTTSGNFPTTPGAFDCTFGGRYDVFVIKLNSTGSNLDYATFLGGHLYEAGYGIAVNGSGNAYVTGDTRSSDFPTTPGVFDSVLGGEREAFVAKFNSTGSALDYATFLGGDDNDYGRGIAVDGSGNAYVTGHTESENFPTTAGAFDESHNGFFDIFVVKLNLAGSDCVYSTFLGGNNSEHESAIAVESSGNAYVTGRTSSSNFPTTAGAFDKTHNGYADVFVVKLNPAGVDLAYSTYLGGSNSDYGCAIDVDNAGNVYLAGETTSNEFPVITGAFDTTHNGGADAFVAKLNPTGSAIEYSTFLGGSGDDNGWGIALDDSGDVYVTGRTWSSDFPATAGVFDTSYNGGPNPWDRGDAFVAKFDLSGYPVPVILTSFQATGGLSFIALEWVTATEVNCHEWMIYRSDQEDGEYAPIGELPGHGSTEVAHTYQWVDRQVKAGVIYHYKLRQIDFDGSSSWSSVVSATAGSSVPRSCALRQNYPNPFNAGTEIRYQIPQDGHVTLKIYNTLGQEVRTLLDVQQKAGEYGVLWDGRDTIGHEVASGLYFCRLRAGEFGKTVKMVLIK